MGGVWLGQGCGGRFALPARGAGTLHSCALTVAGTGTWLGVIPPVQEPLCRGRAAPRFCPVQPGKHCWCQGRVPRHELWPRSCSPASPATPLVDAMCRMGPCALSSHATRTLGPLCPVRPCPCAQSGHAPCMTGPLCPVQPCPIHDGSPLPSLATHHARRVPCAQWGCAPCRMGPVPTPAMPHTGWVPHTLSSPTQSQCSGYSRCPTSTRAGAPVLRPAPLCPMPRRSSPRACPVPALLLPAPHEHEAPAQ